MMMHQKGGALGRVGVTKAGEGAGIGRGKKAKRS